MLWYMNNPLRASYLCYLIIIKQTELLHNFLSSITYEIHKLVLNNLWNTVTVLNSYTVIVCDSIIILT